MDSFEWNKIAGSVLAAALVIMIISIGTDALFAVHPLEAKAYVVEGVEEEAPKDAGPAAPAGPSLAELMTTASAEKGATVFKKCATCHSIEKGGPAKTGPNLWGVLGGHHAHMAGFGYSAAMQAKSGETWTWEAMDAWLASPKAAVPGNKMSFAGLSKPEERAHLLAYLNTSTDSPLPLPAAPAKTEAAAAPAEGAAPAEDAAAADAAAPTEGAAPATPAPAPAH